MSRFPTAEVMDEKNPLTPPLADPERAGTAGTAKGPSAWVGETVVADMAAEPSMECLPAVGLGSARLIRLLWMSLPEFEATTLTDKLDFEGRINVSPNETLDWRVPGAPPANETCELRTPPGMVARSELETVKID